MIVVAWVIFVVLVIVGIIGVIAPGLPGAPLVYVGVLVLAAAYRFDRISILTVVVLGLLTLIVSVLDILAAAAGAKRSGASKWGILGAALGLLAGLFFPPFGLIVGPLAGAIAGELLSGRQRDEALKAGWGTFLGLMAGIVVKLALCASLIAVALVAHFFVGN